MPCDEPDFPIGGGVPRHLAAGQVRSGQVAQPHEELKPALPSFRPFTNESDNRPEIITDIASRHRYLTASTY